MDTVEAEAHGVGEGRSKRMVLANCHQLPESCPRVTERRDVGRDGSSRSRLLADVLLNNVIPMEPITLPQFHVDVRRSLVYRDVGQGAASESSKVCRIGRCVSGLREVSSRNERQELLDGWRSDCRPLVLTRYCAGYRPA